MLGSIEAARDYRREFDLLSFETVTFELLAIAIVLLVLPLLHIPSRTSEPLCIHSFMQSPTVVRSIAVNQ